MLAVTPPARVQRQPIDPAPAGTPLDGGVVGAPARPGDYHRDPGRRSGEHAGGGAGRLRGDGNLEEPAQPSGHRRPAAPGEGGQIVERLLGMADAEGGRLAQRRRQAVP